MTEDQKREQKAMILLEFQEASQELAHLLEKAARDSETIKSFASQVSIMSMDSDRGSEAAAVVINSRLDGTLQRTMNVEELAKLAEQILAAKRTLRILSVKKANFGLA